jgi:cysteine rich repeat protein
MSSRHRSLWSALLGAGVLLTAWVVRAEPVPGKACKADLEKACPGIEPGQGRILACLEGKTDQLSQACKDDVSKKFNALYKACRPDAEKLCPGVEMGGGKLLQCLGDNEKTLSSSCKKVWGKPKSKKTAAAK